MSSKGKGKAVATDGDKRKRGGADDDKTGGGKTKRNRAVLQFFEVYIMRSDFVTTEHNFMIFLKKKLFGYFYLKNQNPFFVIALNGTQQRVQGFI